ncbi:hypothetical protein [Streptomyces sp. B6B3]|uniref:hypothetical protein n=1 Tax=Streptomyces sp. B6B3 TaxID=3153570 RepID=UPI00325CFFFF
MSARHSIPRHVARRRLRRAAGTAVAGLALSLGGVITAHATGSGQENERPLDPTGPEGWGSWELDEGDQTPAEGEADVTSPEGAWETPVPEGEADVTSPEGAWETPVPEGEGDVTSPEGAWETPVSEGEADVTSPRGAWETPVPGE